MKTFLFFLIGIVLTSCSSYNKILVIKDRFKEEKNIKLIQPLEGFSDEKRELIFQRPDYSFKLKSVYIQPNNQKGKVEMELSLTTFARPEALDSVVYLLIDNNKYKLKSNDFAMLNYVDRSTSTNTTTEVKEDEKNNEKKDEGSGNTTLTTTSTTVTDQTLQAMKHRFEIPVEWWNKLKNCEEIMLRAYLEKEGIDVTFTNRDINKLTKFYALVLENETPQTVKE